MEVLVYVALLVPTLDPFTLHWYEGALPPLVGVAVKVTLAPLQIGLELALMFTEGVTGVLTVTVRLLLVAVFVV